MRLLMIFSLSAMLMAAAPHCAWAEVLISIDKVAQRMAVSVDGQQRYTWSVSTGAASYDTPSGSFRPLRMARTHFSREWDNAPMPHSIFFTPDGHAIHGTSHARHLGRAVSHGCVRLAPRHAATLFALVRAEGVGSTKVVVEGADGSTLGQSGSGSGVDPLRALQRSAAARSKWQEEPKSPPGPDAAPAISPGPRSGSEAGASSSREVPALSKPGGTAISEAATAATDKDALLTRLMVEGARAYKSICSGC